MTNGLWENALIASGYLVLAILMTIDLLVGNYGVGLVLVSIAMWSFFGAYVEKIIRLYREKRPR